MITIEKAQTLADIYNMKVVDVETRHDCDRYGKIPDYIKINVKSQSKEQNIYVYLGSDYKIVSNKEFYIECKVKNALFGIM